MFCYALKDPKVVRDPLQIFLLVLSEFNGIYHLLFVLKSSENVCFDDFKGNRS